MLQKIVTRLWSRISQSVLNGVLRDNCVDLVLVEKLSFSTQISQNCGSSLQGSPVRKWTSDDVSVVIGASDEQIREHDGVPRVGKVGIHDRVPVRDGDSWVDHPKGNFESLEVFSVPWKETWPRVRSGADSDFKVLTGQAVVLAIAFQRVEGVVPSENWKYELIRVDGNALQGKFQEFSEIVQWSALSTSL